MAGNGGNSIASSIRGPAGTGGGVAAAETGRSGVGGARQPEGAAGAVNAGETGGETVGRGRSTEGGNSAGVANDDAVIPPAGATGREAAGVALGAASNAA